jgi:hypothetical protein
MEKRLGNTALVSEYSVETSTDLRRPKREADHSPSASAEIKNAWSFTSTPSFRIYDVMRARRNFTC